jgi:hypothetical protein
VPTAVGSGDLLGIATKNLNKMKQYLVNNETWFWAKTRIFVRAKNRDAAINRAMKYVRAVYRSCSASTKSREIQSHHFSAAECDHPEIHARHLIGDDVKGAVLIRGKKYYFAFP